MRVREALAIPTHPRLTQRALVVVHTRVMALPCETNSVGLQLSQTECELAL